MSQITQVAINNTNENAFYKQRKKTIKININNKEKAHPQDSMSHSQETQNRESSGQRERERGVTIGGIEEVDISIAKGLSGE